jgi:hypothetical protein
MNLTNRPSEAGKPVGAQPDAETVAMGDGGFAVSQGVGRFSPGQTIATRFTVVRYLACGGMGEVYEVEDRLLQGVHVALKWLAFDSNATGTREVYLMDFPGSSSLHRVSTEGGRMARWRRDGKELFFLATDGSMMAAEVSIGKDLAAATPKRLFPANLSAGSDEPVYDVTRDGQRFLLYDAGTSSTNIEMILNWPSMLRP